MNKQDAIQWCNTSLGKWPRFIYTDLLSPGGWKWASRSDPSGTDIILQKVTFANDIRKIETIEKFDTDLKP